MRTGTHLPVTQVVTAVGCPTGPLADVVVRHRLHRSGFRISSGATVCEILAARENLFCFTAWQTVGLGSLPAKLVKLPTTEYKLKIQYDRYVETDERQDNVQFNNSDSCFLVAGVRRSVRCTRNKQTKHFYGIYYKRELRLC